MDVIDDELGESFVSTSLSRETEAAAIPALWLSAKEEALFQEWKDGLPAVLSLYTLAFAALHVLSVLLTGRMDTSGMPTKDKKLWHNKVVASIHAAAATALGLYWFLGSGEPASLGNRPFVFLPINAHIAAFGVGYFIYDAVVMFALRHLMSASFFWGIMTHHAIFILAYGSTLVLPCSLSVTTYHLFQLTECSTVFLHLSWMASKSQAQYSALFKVSIALLVIFIIRCIINAGIVWHVCTRLLDLQLWDMDIPQVSSAAGIAYSLFFAAGSSGMLFINFKWFTALVARAKQMIKRVQNGQSPTPDYDRPVKSPETAGKKAE